jgi:hypothetical protein
MKLSVPTAPFALMIATACAVVATAGQARAQTDNTPARQEPAAAIGGPVGPAPIVPPIDSDGPYLSGKLTDVKFVRTQYLTGLKLKGLLTIVNSGDKTAKQVRARVYISDGPILKPGAEPIAIAPLATLYKEGNLKPKMIDRIRIKHKLPDIVPLEGATDEGIIIGDYLIIVLSADNFPADAGKHIVYGPLP